MTAPKLCVQYPSPAAADDELLLTLICGIVNSAYTETEQGIFNPSYKRTDSTEVAVLIRTHQLAVAYLTSPSSPIGCISIKQISPELGHFGMLALDVEHRGGGYGRELVKFAEQFCKSLGCTKMQCELLVPTTFRHEFKERNEIWYTRMGYSRTKSGDFKEDWPALEPLLCGPTDYRVFEKSLAD